MTLTEKLQVIFPNGTITRAPGQPTVLIVDVPIQFALDEREDEGGLKIEGLIKRIRECTEAAASMNISQFAIQRQCKHEAMVDDPRCGGEEKACRDCGIPEPYIPAVEKPC